VVASLHTQISHCVAPEQHVIQGNQLPGATYPRHQRTAEATHTLSKGVAGPWPTFIAPIFNICADSLQHDSACSRSCFMLAV
jgi:hypothetical protein